MTELQIIGSPAATIAGVSAGILKDNTFPSQEAFRFCLLDGEEYGPLARRA
jgi:hypothetical protein